MPRLYRSIGSAAANPMAANGPFHLRAAVKPDLTLHALLAELRERGTIVARDTLWRFGAEPRVGTARSIEKVPHGHWSAA